MPISVSAKKSLRVGIRRTEENRSWKLRIKNQLKKTTAETVRETVALLDKAAKHDVIHKNKASRLKSRLMKQFSTSGTAQTDTKAAAKPTKTTRTAPAKTPAKKRTKAAK